MVVKNENFKATLTPYTDLSIRGYINRTGLKKEVALNIIDSHFHIYKSERAGLLAQGGDSLIGFKGTLDEAKSILDKGRISKVMALAVIPIGPMRQAAMKTWPPGMAASEKKESQDTLEEKLQTRLSGYNDWLCSAAREDGRIEPVIMADPTIDSGYMTHEIVSKFETYGIKALKIHPAVNSLSPAHEGYDGIFKIALEKDLTIISHGGLSGEDPEGQLCSPDKFQKVLKKFPDLKFVIAHLAYPHVDALRDLSLQYPNLYTDISFVLRHSPLTDDEICAAVRGFGTERVLFGSDFPWCDPEKDIDRLLNLKLSSSEIDALTHQNAVRLFGLA